MELTTQDIIVSCIIVVLLIAIGAAIFYKVGKDSKKCKETNCSFQCSPGLGCHLVNKKVNEKKGIYGDYVKCTESCSQPQPPQPTDYDVRSLIYTLTNNNPGQSLPQDKLDYLVSYFMGKSDIWASFSKGDLISQLYFIKLVMVGQVANAGGINMTQENVACIANFFKESKQNEWGNFLKDDNKNQLDFLTWTLTNICK